MPSDPVDGRPRAVAYDDGEGGAAPSPVEKFGREVYVSQDLIAEHGERWRERERRRFQEEIEGRGYTLVEPVQLWRVPWTEMEIAQEVPDRYAGADRYRVTGMFTIAPAS